MIQPSPFPADAGVPPPLARLARLAPLDAGERDLLRRVADRARASPARSELVSEGEAGAPAILLLEGWACRQRLLLDGRRQIACLSLPGDLVSLNGPTRALASVVSLSQVKFADPTPLIAAARAGNAPGLAQAIAASARLDEAHLLAQIVRLGRQTAYERIAHLLVETRDRLRLAGIIVDDHYRLPLSQEVIGDTLGLTPVHVNRTLMLMGRDGMIARADGVLTLLKPEALEAMADHRPLDFSHLAD